MYRATNNILPVNIQACFFSERRGIQFEEGIKSKTSVRTLNFKKLLHFNMWSETVEQTSGGAQTMSSHAQIQTAVQKDDIYKVQGRRGV